MEISFPAGRAGQIMIVDGLVPEGTCSNLLRNLDEVWTTVAAVGRTMGGIMPTTKNSEDFHFSAPRYMEKGLDWTPELAGIEAAFVDALSSAIAIYRAEYEALYVWENIEDTGFQIQRYLRQHGHYRPHVDSIAGTNTANRMAAAIFYLNTVEHGGETAFPLHEAKVEAIEGRLVLFPATWTHLHEGRPPISSDKWIINTFLLNVEPQSPPESPLMAATTDMEQPPPKRGRGRPRKNQAPLVEDHHHGHDHDHDHHHSTPIILG